MRKNRVGLNLQNNKQKFKGNQSMENHNASILETDRLILRKFTQNDIEDSFINI